MATVCYLLASTGIPVLPFPAGTANLLALNLASPLEPHALAKMVRAGKTLDFDMGEICVDGHRFGFSIMAGAGYDAVIMRGAQRRQAAVGPHGVPAIGGGQRHAAASKFTLTLDGRQVQSEASECCWVNFSKIPVRISRSRTTTSRATAEFDVVVLKAKTAFDLIPAAIAGLLDRDGEFPDRTDALEIFRAKEVTIEADPAMEVQYDGEATSLFTPFSARIMPRATRLFISDEGYSQFAR